MSANISVNKSKHVYLIVADRKTSQFDQTIQEIRCHALDVYRDHMLVESMKRYNKKYAGASKSTSGKYKDLPVRRINRDQVLRIRDEKTGQVLSWETVRRREGTSRKPGRARGGR
jgi:hypothetical protein